MSFKSSHWKGLKYLPDVSWTKRLWTHGRSILTTQRRWGNADGRMNGWMNETQEQLLCVAPTEAEAENKAERVRTSLWWNRRPLRSSSTPSSYFSKSLCTQTEAPPAGQTSINTRTSFTFSTSVPLLQPSVCGAERLININSLSLNRPAQIISSSLTSQLKGWFILSNRKTCETDESCRTKSLPFMTRPFFTASLWSFLLLLLILKTFLIKSHWTVTLY